MPHHVIMPPCDIPLPRARDHLTNTPLADK